VNWLPKSTIRTVSGRTVSGRTVSGRLAIFMASV
jgi:hypothetical protein